MTNSHDDARGRLEAAAAKFLDRFDLGPSAVDPALYLAEVIQVGSPRGCSSVTREDFVAGITARAAAVPPLARTRAEYAVSPLGDSYATVSARWNLTVYATDPSRHIVLVGDFLLDVTAADARCLVYLTRQDIFELIRGAADAPAS